MRGEVCYNRFMTAPHRRLDAAVKWLRELVAFDTTPPHTNKSLVDHIAARLQDENGIRGERLDGGENKTTFFATIGPHTDGGIALSGHTDVVATDGQNWSSPPFELRESDGKLFARGACDMKGFLACVLASAPDFAAAALKKPVHFAFSRDEEIACAGSLDMLQLIKQCGMRPGAAFIGEPTRMKIVAGHKTGLTMRTVFRGSPAHSSAPAAGVSAIPFAARFVCHLENLERQMRENAAAGSPFSPPYGTINVGTIHGGTALNIFAEHCALDWHYRGMPEDDMDAFAAAANDYLQKKLLPEMRRNGHPADIVNTRISSYPGLLPDESAALSLARTLSGETDYEVVSFGTEAGYFQQDGIPAVVIGPGDIAQAHKPDEFLEKTQMSDCLDFLDKLRAHLSA